MISSQAVKNVQRLEKEHLGLSATRFSKSTISPDSIEEIRMSNFKDSDFLFPSNWAFLSFSSLIRTLFFRCMRCKYILKFFRISCYSVKPI